MRKACKASSGRRLKRLTPASMHLCKSGRLRLLLMNWPDFPRLLAAHLPSRTTLMCKALLRNAACWRCMRSPLRRMHRSSRDSKRQAWCAWASSTCTRWRWALPTTMPILATATTRPVPATRPAVPVAGRPRRSLLVCAALLWVPTPWARCAYRQLTAAWWVSSPVLTHCLPVA